MLTFEKTPPSSKKLIYKEEKTYPSELKNYEKDGVFKKQNGFGVL